MKKLLGWAFAILLVVVGVVWFFFGGGITEHIEDTNGPNNYTLQTITDQNIVDLDTGSMGAGKSTAPLSATKYHSNKFSGVEVIHEENLWSTGLSIDVYNYTVREGNFRLVVLLNGEIVHEFVPNGDLIQTCELGPIEGLLSLRIAGESADYEFSYDIW